MKIDFDKIKELHIVCIGDIMLDAFVYGSVERISPEAPVPVMKTTHTDYMLGGVGNVVVNLLNLGAKVTLFSMIGEDESGQRIAEMLQKFENLEAHVFVDPSIKTTTKTRYVSGKQHLVRIDDEDFASPNTESEAYAIEKLIESGITADVLIISDYNKGFVSKALKQAIASLPDSVYKILDTKGDLRSYMNIDMVTPNVKELEKYSGQKISSPAQVSSAIDKFYTNHAIPTILVTASENGMVLYEQLGIKSTATPTSPTQPIWRVHAEPAYNNNPVDVSGAGDTVVASIAVAIALDVDYQYALEFASHCSAVAIGKKGTSHVELTEIKQRYNLVRTDYRDHTKVINTIRLQKKMGRTIGLVNGCFDLLHAGHLELLRKSKEVCNYLIVAINSDTTVKALKGNTRPIIDEQTRAEILEALKYVDAVVIFDEETPIETITKFVPDFIFKGKDYEGKELAEQEIVDRLDTSIIFFDTAVQSTTAIIKKIKDE